ncbi:diacylglycerol/lipid kinase family protein [Bacteroidota bacterium]
MKLLYLNNPAAGHKNGVKIYPKILKYFEKCGIDFDNFQTEYAGHGTEIVKSADLNKYDAIAVSGGDGTVYEALNGYFNNNSERRIPFGVIPIGRGNALARDLGLFPPSYSEAIDTIVNGKTTMVDVGKFTTEGKTLYFLNILGFGFVTDVGQTASKIKFLGNLSYLTGVFYQTAALKSYNLKIELDGKVLERDNVFVEISNSRYTGKDFLMAPDAKIDDGFLDVTLANKITRRRLLIALPKIFTGKHIFMKEIESIQAKHIKIETDPPKLLTPDGQLLGTTPIEVECLKQAIEVFVK